uniref:MARVEL domain-containing protein n=1 Tax=Leptocylindrus danicus TaxID=163516 RepID=A0A7S2PAZ7_9STRA|mmetsp:Transcript_27522/g.40610  ORF Transcript_27522/g.40610 Transcript_27522/m.40610 type:complete len:263 (+) Transcript_27522:66-854(+)
MSTTDDATASKPKAASTQSYSDEQRPRVSGYRIGNNPHGGSICFPLTFTTTAWLLSMFANQFCTFAYRKVTFEDPNIAFNETLTIFPPANTTISTWSYQGVGLSSGICFRYPSYFETDSAFQAARAFTILVAVFGFVSMIRIWFAACMPMGTASWACTGYKLLLCCLLEGLCFLIFSSNVCADGVTDSGQKFKVDCSVDRGARIGIAAVVFWFVAALSVLNVDPPIDDIYGPVAVQKVVTKTETINPDGTKDVKTETRSYYV